MLLPKSVPPSVTPSAVSAAGTISISGSTHFFLAVSAGFSRGDGSFGRLFIDGRPSASGGCIGYGGDLLLDQLGDEFRHGPDGVFRAGVEFFDNLIAQFTDPHRRFQPSPDRCRSRVQREIFSFLDTEHDEAIADLGRNRLGRPHYPTVQAR